MYRVVVRNSAKKFLQRLSKNDYARFSRSIYSLARDPFGGDVKKLRGDVAGAYRLRVGKWRVLFLRDDRQHVIDIVIIDKRGDIY